MIINYKNENIYFTLNTRINNAFMYVRIRDSLTGVENRVRPKIRNTYNALIIL